MKRLLTLLGLVKGSGPPAPAQSRHLTKHNDSQASLLEPAPGTSMRVRPPRRKGLTEQERLAEQEAFNQRLLAKFTRGFDHDRKRASSAGSTGYIWRSTKDGDVCAACKRNQGKRFGWDNPPSCGHPGTFLCVCGNPCRCFAEAVFPK